MPHSSQIQSLFATLRGVERTARARLIAGCADDVAKLERFFERPLAVARRDAHDALAGIGPIPDADLAANLRRETFERIGVTSAETVCANVGLRARARFKMYADELAKAEAPITDAIVATHLVAAKRPLPRMFSVGRIDIDGLRAPDPPERPSEIDGWVVDLHACIRDEISTGVKAALDRVLARGFNRLAVIKTRIDLALCKREIGSS